MRRKIKKLLILIALMFINIEKTHESAHTEEYTQVSVVGDIRETNTYKTYKDFLISAYGFSLTKLKK